MGPGVFSAGVEPTCRKGATAAADNGIMYFFGGANENLYDDLFQYSNDPLNPDQWAYLYLETTFPELSNYGPPVPKPGSRVDAASFIYGNSFYLYGGQGTGGTAGDNGDLWRYDGLDFPTHTIPQWSWIHGDSALNTPASHGLLGVASSINKPGSRFACTINPDLTSDGQFILFGGAVGGYGIGNDLWIYNAKSNIWTWINGSDTNNVVGSYGVKNVQSPYNSIGARYGQASWITRSGEMYVFGGWTATYGKANDLWKFSGRVGIWTGAVS